MNSERRPASLGERWRRLTSSGIEDNELEKALASLPSIRSPRIRIAAGSIHTEMEGSMGSINEVSVSVPRLPARIWSQVVRVMRRSTSMREALRSGKLPSSFDRLIARISGESVLPETRRVSSACSCGGPESPCRHILALHELFARRLDETPAELLTLRGVDLHSLLEQASRAFDGGEPPLLAFGAIEEPVLFPEGEDGDLDSALTGGQIRHLVGGHQASVIGTVAAAIRALDEPAEVTAPPDPSD